MNNAATDLEGFSRWLTKLFKPGVATGWSVTQRGAGANMSVDISAGDGVPMTTDTAPWDWTTAVENVAIAAASANNRRDLIVAYTDLSITNPSTSTPNNPGALKFLAVTGTPATSPSDPNNAAIRATAVGATNPYLVLARVSLTSSTTQITNAQITSLITPMALNVLRIWGGSNSTLGHQIPNVADAFLALTSRSDGKVDFAALLSTIFSGQVQSQANSGSAGGTINYVNLGGIKLAWGLTGSLTVPGAAPSAATFGITWPTSFFSTVQAATISAAAGTASSSQFIYAAPKFAVNTTSWTFDLVSTNGSNGNTSQACFFVIGT
jgi:hypothetical protein